MNNINRLPRGSTRKISSSCASLGCCFGFADPSSKQVISYDPVKDKRTFTTVKTEGIRFLPWLSEREQASSGKEAVPYAFLNIPVYQWDDWSRLAIPNG